MNYYRRYSGDYLRDTSRLSMVEHGAYSLMLDYYYSDEKPLPLDRDELYLMLRAMKPADRAAVDKVLSMYFTKQADGWHQKRCDHEILVSKKARTNGNGGGRPSGKSETGLVTGIGTGLVTGFETDDETGEETETITGSGHPPTTNHQPPPTTLQPPEKNTPRDKRASAVPKPPDVPDSVWTDFLAIRKAKRAPMTATALQGMEREAEKAGMAIADVLAMCCERGWQGFRAEWATGTTHAGGKPIDVARLVAELEAEEAARATH